MNIKLTHRQYQVVVKSLECVLESGGAQDLQAVARQAHQKQCKLVTKVLKKLNPMNQAMCPDC